jgi:hypothetical protein
MPKMKQDWQNELELLLNVPEQEVLRRNRAITAQYARWYTKHPDVFKWAGAAAFASDRVGLILLLHQGFAVTERVKEIGPVSRGDEKDGNAGVRDLDLIRQTNNAVFADIGWAHLAYIDGGLAAIESGLGAGPPPQLMLAGFRQIDHGKQLLASSPSEAKNFIWEGNRLLLQHEQSTTVQNHFDQLQQPQFKQFLSSLTDIDFDANNFQIDQKTYTSFQKYTLQFPLPRGTLPDITDFEQRWRWVEREVWRIWQTVEKNDPRLREKMDSLIEKAKDG